MRAERQVMLCMYLWVLLRERDRCSPAVEGTCSSDVAEVFESVGGAVS